MRAMENVKNFALIGAAGFVAPRHLRAIKETQNRLVVALDKFDSVGVLDQYFPETQFFLEFERFDRHLEKLRRQNSAQKVDYVSICSPNYLHDAHCRSALRLGAHAICEKPLVINPWNLDVLSDLEKEYERKIFTILQLRLHPQVQKLKKMIAAAPPEKKFQVDLIYITARGPWYFQSWKGDPEKSGGIITNIGIHLFDLLIYLFGPVKTQEVWERGDKKASGLLEFGQAQVRWFLSVDFIDIPTSSHPARSFRALKIDEEVLELSQGFENLHTESYKNVLNGTGFGLEEARASVELTHKIRHQEVNGKTDPSMWRIQENFYHVPHLHS